MRRWTLTVSQNHTPGKKPNDSPSVTSRMAATDRLNKKEVSKKESIDLFKSISGDESSSSSEEGYWPKFKRIWNEEAEAHGFTRVLGGNPKRLLSLATRMKEPFFRDNWEATVRLIHKDDFYCGRKKDSDWYANADWFLQPGKCAEVYERLVKKPNKDLSDSRSGNKEAKWTL